MSPLPRVALVGCGRIGQLHARNLAALRDMCEFVAIADWNLEAAETAARLLDIPRATADSEEVLSSPDVDAVVIASSTSTHAAYIELAARHGKDIFTEKPIALDLETTQRALDAVEAAGVRLQVGFQRRFDSGYLAAREAIRQGEIGRIEMIRDAMRDPSPPPLDYVRQSGGLYRDMTIHNFDAVRWLMDEEPVELYAAASALVSDEIRDAGRRRHQHRHAAVSVRGGRLDREQPPLRLRLRCPNRDLWLRGRADGGRPSADANSPLYGRRRVRGSPILLSRTVPGSVPHRDDRVPDGARVRRRHAGDRPRWPCGAPARLRRRGVAA